MGTQHSLSIHTTLPLFYRREQKIYLKVPGFLRSPLPLPRLLRNPGNPKRSRVSALAPLVNVSHCGKVRWGALVAYPVGTFRLFGWEKAGRHRGKHVKLLVQMIWDKNLSGLFIKVHWLIGSASQERRDLVCGQTNGYNTALAGRKVSG